MNLGRRLRFLRYRLGISQRALSERAGVTQAAIARIERGLSSPRFETAQRLFEACGYELEAQPRRGLGIDRTAIRELLRLSPEERARLATQEARNMEEVLSRARP